MVCTVEQSGKERQAIKCYFSGYHGDSCHFVSSTSPSGSGPIPVITWSIMNYAANITTRLSWDYLRISGLCKGVPKALDMTIFVTVNSQSDNQHRQSSMSGYCISPRSTCSTVSNTNTFSLSASNAFHFTTTPSTRFDIFCISSNPNQYGIGQLRISRNLSKLDRLRAPTHREL